MLLIVKLFHELSVRLIQHIIRVKLIWVDGQAYRSAIAASCGTSNKNEARVHCWKRRSSCGNETSHRCIEQADYTVRRCRAVAGSQWNCVNHKTSTTWRVMDRLLRLLVSVKESRWGEHGGGTDDDGLVERLSRRYTSTLLAAFAMMVTTKQFVGEPISCWCPTYFTDGQKQYTNNICWISNTFYVPLPVRI